MRAAVLKHLPAVLLAVPRHQIFAQQHDLVGLRRIEHVGWCGRKLREQRKAEDENWA